MKLVSNSKLEKIKLKLDASKSSEILDYNLSLYSVISKYTKIDIGEFTSKIRKESPEIFKEVSHVRIAETIFEGMLKGLRKKKNLYQYVLVNFKEVERRLNWHFSSSKNQLTDALSKLRNEDYSDKVTGSGSIKLSDVMPIDFEKSESINVDKLTDYGNNPMEQEYLELISSLLNIDYNEAEKHLYEIKKKAVEFENPEFLRTAFNIEGDSDDVEHCKEIFKSDIAIHCLPVILNEGTNVTTEKILHILDLFYNDCSRLTTIAEIHKFFKNDSLGFWKIASKVFSTIKKPLSYYGLDESDFDFLNDTIGDIPAPVEAFSSEEISDKFQKIKNCETVVLYSVDRLENSNEFQIPVCEYYTCYGKARSAQIKLSKKDKSTHVISEYVLDTENIVFMEQKGCGEIVIAINQKDRENGSPGIGILKQILKL